MIPIVRLVREKVAGRGLRPFAKERDIPYSTLRMYHDEQLPPLRAMPREDTLRQLAHGLQVPFERLRQAAIDSLAGRYDAASSEPTRDDDAAEGEVLDVRAAIQADPHLLPEAKEHLLRQYGLLLRVRAEAEEVERLADRQKETQRAVTDLAASKAARSRRGGASGTRRTPPTGR